MSARAIRIEKEARALFWPWCAVVGVGMLPVLLPHEPTAARLNEMSFFLGIPLLATLSLGEEFYHRTISLWLTQPVSRIELWLEKTLVMCVAVLSAAAVSGAVMFLYSLPTGGLTYNKTAAVAYILIAMASATYWTLAARSTTGGFVLIACVFWSFYMFVEEAKGGRISAQATSPATLAAVAAFTVCFAGLMFWLGARKLVRFQSEGGSSGEDLLMYDASVMPGPMAEWFRCRPTGATLNLIRKEFRLLRAVWWIEFLALVYLAALAMLRLLPTPPTALPRNLREWVVLGPIFAVFVGLTGLAGILSLGEEKSTETQAWHMTLPVSLSRQWFIKLAVAVFTGLACGVLLPVLTMIAAGTIYGSPLMFVFTPALPTQLLMYPMLTCTCFWCACATNGTVRAAAWAAPATFSVFYTATEGVTLGWNMAEHTGTLKDFVVSSFHLSPFALDSLVNSVRGTVIWLFVPVMLAAFAQSYRLYRVRAQDTLLWMVRWLGPLLLVTFVWSFGTAASVLGTTWEPFDEARHALDKLQPAAAKLEITGDDLSKGAAFSERTKRWLAGAKITITPGRSAMTGYLATIHLASGLECTLRATPGGGSAAACGN